MAVIYEEKISTEYRSNAFSKTKLVDNILFLLCVFLPLVLVVSTHSKY